MRYQIGAMFLFVLVFTAAPLLAGETENANRKAIQTTALNYMDGAHDGDAARMAIALHEELNKASIMELPNGRQVLRKSGYSRLVEIIRADGVHVPKTERNIQVDIHYVGQGIAAVTVTSSVFHDLLQIAEINGEWKIINALWTRQTLTAKDETGWMKESDAIKQAALDYIEGAFSSNAERMARGIHPALNKAIPVVHPKTGKTLLNYTTSDLLIEGSGAGLIALDKEQWNIDLQILDVYQGIASVAILSTPYVDLLQLARLNGQWKIVNVLWVSNPKKEPAPETSPAGS